METDFSGRVSKCGAELMQWANKEFGSIRKRKKDLTQLLTEYQSLEDQMPMQEKIQQTEAELDQVLKAEETMWYQRSRALWLKDGDRNSSFFHNKASMRKKRNTINHIQDEKGIEVTKKEDIVKVVRDYYVKIFSSDGGNNVENVLKAVECRVTSEMNDLLMKPFTVKEVVKAIKQMHPDKAPGPDGMTPLFFQKYWSIVKNDVISTILGILNQRHDPTSLNHTHIVLIPKVKSPLSPADFRPISLCNVM